MKTTICLSRQDCLLGMAALKKESVDMVLCDLPYGMTQNTWDVPIEPKALWEKYKHAIKPTSAVVLFGSQPFSSQIVVSNPQDFRYSLVWEKNKFSNFLDAKRKPMKIHEDILIFYRKQPVYNPQYTYSTPYKRWNTQKAVDKQTNYNKHNKNVAESKDGRRLPTSILRFNRVERPQHPTQKPVDLCSWLIETYTNPGQVIMDNCMGSGTTAIACVETKRSFVGFEMDEKYYKVSKERVMEALGASRATFTVLEDDEAKLHIECEYGEEQKEDSTQEQPRS